MLNTVHFDPGHSSLFLPPVSSANTMEKGPLLVGKYFWCLLTTNVEHLRARNAPFTAKTGVHRDKFWILYPKKRAGSRIRWSVFGSLRSVIRWILVRSGIDGSRSENRFAQRNATDQKTWSGSSQRNTPLHGIRFVSEHLELLEHRERYLEYR